jgi:Holliday junction resolvasome RuvABC ATP-dependent DNA helicase subunit
LRLTPHNHSPSVLGKIVRSSARQVSFEEAAEALDDLAELTISSRQTSRIAQEVGQRVQDALRKDRET